ncbi:MAG TPA: bifunctional phosphoribosylaminoimidazolecarboxamide formyltransferase/IMP cyclohydrolase [Vicinamibacterales bacterium]|nr:bifunctional phosphoribosylaminoimidazolecarboxamide formyltransferase/IMP cyclohydrolase [Vicinamibacterales bacterium]
MRAILSVSDKAGLVDLGRGLSRLGCELISTGGTSKTLTASGLTVTSVAAVTGMPEMLDGRVKTLHPAIHGGILARRHKPEDLAALADHGIAPVDLVVVNLYPFRKAATNPDTPFDDLIEEIDIGGPSLLRAAAKNFRDVLAVVDPADYPRVLEQLERPAGPALEFRLELMRKAFAHTADYDTMIASTMASVTVTGDRIRRDPGSSALSPSPLLLSHQEVPLRYGENPHQKAAWIPGGSADRAWSVHQGKELSFTNLLDLDAAVRVALEFAEPAGVVIKHTNPCGVATGATLAEAYVRAREADALSAFGGIVGLNRPVDVETARALTSTFIEAVVAPAVSPDAAAVLAGKANMRVVTVDFAGLEARWGDSAHREARSFLGGSLIQDSDRVTEARTPWPDGDFPRVVTRRVPTPAEWTGLRFAWRVCGHVKSNAVIFAAEDRTVAVGAGQMSRVDAVRVAVMKGGEALQGTVVASDAFFPFRDGLDALAAAGATAVVQPGGSVRDADVIAAADEHGLAMVFTGRRHFRH